MRKYGNQVKLVSFEKAGEPQPLTMVLLKCIFATFGVFTNPQHRKYGYWYRFFYYSSVVVPGIVSELFALLSERTYIEIIDIVLFLSSTFTISSIPYIMGNKEQYLVDIYNALTANDFVDRKFFVECDGILKSMIRRLFLMVLACVSMLLIYPFLIAFATEAKYGSIPTLMFPAKYPWSTNTLGNYLLTLVLQGCMTSVAFCIINGIILFAMVSHIITRVFFSVMRDKINSLDSFETREMKFHDWTNYFKGRNDSRMVNQNACKVLHDVVKYHRFFNK